MPAAEARIHALAVPVPTELEQIGDLVQREPEPLCGLDDAQQRDRLGGVEPLPSGAAVRFSQKTSTFVVPLGLDVHLSGSSHRPMPKARDCASIARTWCRASLRRGGPARRSPRRTPSAHQHIDCHVPVPLVTGHAARMRGACASGRRPPSGPAPRRESRRSGRRIPGISGPGGEPPRSGPRQWTRTRRSRWLRATCPLRRQVLRRARRAGRPSATAWRRCWS